MREVIRMQKRKSLTTRFCHCIKSVRKTVRVRPGQKKEKEKAAIGICVRSVLQTKGKTLKQFRCSTKPYLRTQPIIRSIKNKKTL